jgi:transcriptional regulator with XRE-family HTH domain
VKKKTSKLQERVIALEAKRERANVSLRSLAKEVGCEHSTLLRIASGETKRVAVYLVDAWDRKLTEIIAKRMRDLQSASQ